MNEKQAYPVNLEIDYVEKHNRTTTLFRIFLAIPFLILLSLLTENGLIRPHHPDIEIHSQAIERESNIEVVSLGGGFIVIPTALMILFRKKYPRWWFNFNVELVKFMTRVFSYLIFLMDTYPSTEEEQAVHIDIPYPDAQQDLKRGMPLVKWFLAIPHYIVLALLYIGVVFCVIITWFAVLFTGKYPKAFFDYIVGVMRWSLRVSAYAILLVTDQYPPFQL